MGRSSTVAQPQKRDADTKLAQSRLSVLELARELGTVAEACRQRGLDRTSFYEWKRRFQTRGFEGLKDLAPIHNSHPQTTPPETVERIRDPALAHPAYGCNRHEAMLALEGIRVLAITIQKIFNDSGLGTKVERWLARGRQGTPGRRSRSHPNRRRSWKSLIPAFGKGTWNQAPRVSCSRPIPSSSAR